VPTLRGKENFHFTSVPMSAEPFFVKAFGYVKKAAALANRDLGVLEPGIADAIAAASRCFRPSSASSSRPRER
jgi:aspartate ammonia-lyase